MDYLLLCGFPLPCSRESFHHGAIFSIALFLRSSGESVDQNECEPVLLDLEGFLWGQQVPVEQFLENTGMLHPPYSVTAHGVLCSPQVRTLCRAPG